MANDPTTAQLPPIRWLRGDEVVLTAKGEFYRLPSIYRGQNEALREALAIWPGDQVPDEKEVHAALRNALTREGLEMAKRRVQHLGNSYKTLMTGLNSNYDMWQIGPRKHYPQAAYKKADEDIGIKQRNIHPALLQLIKSRNTIGQDLEAFFQRDAEWQAHVLDRTTFESDRALIEHSPLFTPALRNLFSYADVPIGFVPDMTKLMGSNKRMYNLSSGEQGLILSQNALDWIQSDNTRQQYDGLRNLARGLVFAAVGACGADATELGVANADHWARLSAEFKEHAASIMTLVHYQEEASRTQSLPDILSQMHFALTSGLYDPAKVRAEMPECTALYDHFMQYVARLAEKRKKSPLYDPARLPARAKAVTVPIEPVTPTPVEKASPSLHFLRGDECILSDDGKWYWAAKGGATPLALTPAYLSKRKIEEASEHPSLHADSLTTPLERVTGGVLRYRNAAVLMIDHPRFANSVFAQGSEPPPAKRMSDMTRNRILIQAGHHIKRMPAYCDKFLRNSNYLGKYPISETDQRIMSSLVLNKEDYYRGMKDLQANQDFQAVAELLKKNRIAVMLTAQPNNNTTDCEFNLRYGLVVTDHFIANLTSDDRAKHESALHRLYAEMAIAAILTQDANWRKLGIARDEDFIDIQHEFGKFLVREGQRTGKNPNAHLLNAEIRSIIPYYLAADEEVKQRLHEQAPKFCHYIEALCNEINPQLVPQQPGITKPTVASNEVAADATHAQMPQFLRGDEFALWPDGTAHHIANAGARASAYIISLRAFDQDADSAAQLFNNRFHHPAYRQTQDTTIQMLIRQQSAGLMQMKSYPSLALASHRSQVDADQWKEKLGNAVLRAKKGISDLGANRLQLRQLNKVSQYLTKDGVKKIQFDAAEAASSRAVMLDDAEYVRLQDELTHCIAFQKVAPLLIKSHMPVYLQGGEHKGETNMKVGFGINPNTGLVLQNEFVAKLASSNTEVSAYARRQLYAKLAWIPLHSNVSTLHNFGLETDADFVMAREQYLAALDARHIPRPEAHDGKYEVQPLQAMLEFFQQTIDDETYPQLVAEAPKFAEFGLKVMTAVNPNIGKQAEALLHVSTPQPPEPPATLDSDKIKEGTPPGPPPSEVPHEPVNSPVEAGNSDPTPAIPPIVDDMVAGTAVAGGIAGIVAATTPPMEPSVEDIPRLDLSKWEFKPHLFSDDALESAMVDEVRPLLHDALTHRVPYNQFRCHLVTSDRNPHENYFVHLTFGNADKEKREFSISTGTSDFDDAVELKKRIQSHILNHPDIVPMRMRMRSDKPERITQTEESLPQCEPQDINLLVAEGGLYEAVLTYPGGEEAVIPLGIQDKRRGKASEDEAELRMFYLLDHLASARQQGYWETVGEVTHALERAVRNQAALSDGKELNGEWTRGDNIPLQYFGEKIGRDIAYDFGFPANSQQRTVLRSAVLRLEEGSKHPNPIWRLNMVIEVNGLGEDGTESKSYTMGLNLHTANLTAAQSRGFAAVQGLVDDFKLISEFHPDMHWVNLGNGVNEDAGDLCLYKSDGSQLLSPEPQTLSDLLDDMPNPKQSFKITHHLGAMREDGMTPYSIAVERGTKADNDLVVFKNYNTKKPLRTTYLLPETDLPKASDLARTVHDSFTKEIKNAYSNRDEKGNRKPRQKFHPGKIKNAFEDALEKHVSHLIVDDKMSHADEVMASRSEEQGDALGKQSRRA